MNNSKKRLSISEKIEIKCKELVSNFRLSIVFRISLNYIKVVFVSFITFIIWFVITYFLIEGGSQFVEVADLLKSSEKELSINNGLFENHNDIFDKFNELKIKGIGTEIVNEASGEVLYSNVFVNNKNRYIYQGLENNENILIINTKMEIKPDNMEGYTAYIQYNITKIYNKIKIYAMILTASSVIILARVHSKGKKGTKDILAPIEEMSHTANRLSGNNLSERINVAGIKNELKDLAIVINNMLDRIETSYDSQKQFVSDASHELRTPIAVIQGYANLLDRWGKTDKEVMEESIEAIKNESQEMQSLVEKLLFLARHDKKTLKLDKETFDMKELIEDMVRDTKLIVKDKEIIGNDIENFLIHGDKQAIKQGIRVFIDNAVKYTAKGKKITLSCKVEGDYGVVSVIDTGIGMSKEDLNNIFNRFYRSEAVRNENISGHGLGLSIAKLIILSHGGKIKVRSKLGKGSAFMLYFPIIKELN